MLVSGYPLVFSHRGRATMGKKINQHKEGDRDGKQDSNPNPSPEPTDRKEV